MDSFIRRCWLCFTIEACFLNFAFLFMVVIVYKEPSHGFASTLSCFVCCVLSF